MDKEIISLENAKASGLLRYYTGVPCKKGHLCDRYVKSKVCVDCTRSATKLWTQSHPESVKISNEKWRKANPEQWKKSYSKEVYKKKKAKSDKKRQKENPSYYAALTSNRRAYLKKSTPVWVDYTKILELYKEAQRLSRETGIEYQVDHIWPLVGQDSCGLHVSENMRIETKENNQKKSNKRPDDLGLTDKYYGWRDYQ